MKNRRCVHEYQNIKKAITDANKKDANKFYFDELKQPILNIDPIFKRMEICKVTTDGFVGDELLLHWSGNIYQYTAIVTS